MIDLSSITNHDACSFFEPVLRSDSEESLLFSLSVAEEPRQSGFGRLATLGFQLHIVCTTPPDMKLLGMYVDQNDRASI